MPAPDFMPDSHCVQPVVGHVEPARERRWHPMATPIKLSDNDIERIANRVVELMREDK